MRLSRKYKNQCILRLFPTSFCKLNREKYNIDDIDKTVSEIIFNRRKKK